MKHPISTYLQELGLSDLHAPDLQQWQQFLERSGQLETEAGTISSEEQKLLLPRLQTILESLPDIVFLLDEDGRYLEILTQQNEQLARPVDQLKGRRVSDVIPAFQAETIMLSIRDALSLNELIMLQYDLEVQAGLRMFEGRVAPTRLMVDGRRTVVLLSRDITDQFESHARRGLINSVFQAVTEGVVILDESRRVVSCNQAFESITGYREAELRRLGPDLLLRAADSSMYENIWLTVERTGHWKGELLYKNKDDTSSHLWLTLDAIRSPGHVVRHYVALLTDVSDFKRSQAQLEHVATHDALTDLPNRMLFRDRLEQAVARAVRSEQSGALLFLDLDRFKGINDSLGHPVGDSLLIQVARRLRELVREEDTLARLGGDEFTLIIERMASDEMAAAVAEKIIEAFRETFHIDNYDLQVSTSIGISIFPRDARDVDTLIKHADTAMYSAKEAGRNTYHFFTPALTDNANRYFELELDMRRALKNDEFFLLYQPQYNLETGRIVAVEALIRWQPPDGKIVMPVQFITVAENSGLIDQIGDWVLQEVCRQIRVWDAQALPQVRVALNLSRRQLVNPGLSRRTEELLKKYSIPGDRLECEVTESIIINRGDVAHENLDALHELGISLAIDDFGTGHSSLVNLKRFPLDRLKIDRTFVRDLATDPNDEAIIWAIISLARVMDLEVVAEGVETQEQREFLLSAGCDDVQGYLLSKPVSAKKVAELLLEQEQTSEVGHG